MTGPVISIADLEQVHQIVPDMPFASVIQMARFIAEISPVVGTKLADPDDDDGLPEIYASWPEAYRDALQGIEYWKGELDAQVKAKDARIAVLEGQRDDSEKRYGAAVDLLSAAQEQIDGLTAATATAPEPVAPPQATPPAAPPPAVPDRTGEPWTEAEKARVRELRNQGLTGRQIGALMGRTHQTVNWMIAKLNRNTRQMAATPVAEVAPTLTGSQRELMGRIMRLDEDFTPADDLYLAEQIVARTSLDVIADQLGCDAATVKARWAALLGMDPARLRDGVPLQLQSDLLVVLRQMAGVAA